MTDSATNAHEFSVSEISNALKRTVEDTFGHVRVRGEISGYRGAHSSGHAYFSLKDDRSRLEAVIWKGSFGKLKFRPEEGMEVIATGKLTTYPGSSKYQIVIEQMEPAGAGALMALLEERKRKLAAEGLFDPGRKQLLPFMPRVIGVVTSPTGAVIRDIIHRIADRFPLHVLVWPVRVQGETCGQEVAAAIAGFNALEIGGPIARPDVLIVGRGGGSLEDLWGFNDEIVVRAAADSDIPVISAVGHETDWTLLDLVADMRAPTPTGAAEMAVPVRAELEAQLARLAARLAGGAHRVLDRKREAVRAASRALPSADQLLGLPRRRFDEAAGRLGRALSGMVSQKRLRFDGRAGRLHPGLAANVVNRARERLAPQQRGLDRALDRHIAGLRGDLLKRAARHSLEPLTARLAAASQQTAQLALRNGLSFERRVEKAAGRLMQAGRLLASVSYTSVLQRGFALVRNESGEPVRLARDVGAGQRLGLQFADGIVRVQAQGGEAQKPRKAGAASGAPDLFGDS